jgi:hypothetical protein
MSTYGEYERQKKTSQKPPTEKQLQRVNEYLDHPAIQPYLDKLMRDLDRSLKTRGGIGVTLGWMKAKIAEYNERHPLKHQVTREEKYLQWMKQMERMIQDLENLEGR